MKAIVCTKYGSPDLLELQDVETPIPGDDEVLVRVNAASVTYSTLDVHTRKTACGPPMVRASQANTYDPRS